MSVLGGGSVCVCVGGEGGVQALTSSSLLLQGCGMGSVLGGAACVGSGAHGLRVETGRSGGH